VYERSYDADPGIESYVTREVSLGPAGGNDAYNALFEKASADGNLIFFSTEESMVEADTDHRSDVYMRNMVTGTTTLVSVGEPACAPACGNGPVDAGFAGASADGNKAFFVSEERLAAGDKDNSVDIYVRNLTGVPATETTELVSTGESSCLPGCGNGAFSASLPAGGISRDGSHVSFTTAESLSSADTDSAVDIYSHNLGNGVTTLVSQAGEGCAPPCGNGGKVPVFQSSSEDGSRVFFGTDEALVGLDEDTTTDIYARDLPGGPTILISGGSSSTETASFSAATANGAHVFFTTAEPLVLADDDSANDVYEWSGGTLELVTSAECVSACGASFDAVSSDAGTVLFSTSEQLSLADTDSSSDIYSQQTGGGEPVLVGQRMRKLRQRPG
jgi:Tol biopolymer transport system component